MNHFRLSCYFLSVLNFCTAVPIDNGVVGEPTIDCGSEQLGFWVKTQKPFEGKIYVKGEYGNPACTLQPSPSTVFTKLPSYTSYVTADTKRSTGGTSFYTLPIDRTFFGTTYSKRPPPSSPSPPTGFTFSPTNKPLGKTDSYSFNPTDKTYILITKPQPTAAPICPPCPTCPTNGFASFHQKYVAGPGPPGRLPRELLNSNYDNPNEYHLKIQSGTCNMKRERSLNPAGIFVSLTVVVSFHQHFVTKVDKAYQLRCFFMEADKVVTSVLDVSAPSLTTELSMQAAMPTCYYTIRRGSIDGPELKFAKVGESAYHVWECVTPIPNMYGMLVHSCTVDDGHGTRVQVLNNKGCSLDKHVLGNLTYTSDMLRASVESHVFKFADRAGVDFQCQITICLKSNYGCQDISPPKCVQSVNKREIILINGTADYDSNPSDWNLHAQRFTVIDIDENIPFQDMASLASKFKARDDPQPSIETERDFRTPSRRNTRNPMVCLSVVGFGALISSFTFALTLFVAVFGYIYMARFKYVARRYCDAQAGARDSATSLAQLYKHIFCRTNCN